MDFLNITSPSAIALNWTEAASNRIPYLGEGLFPATQKAGLDLSWIRGAKGVGISLMPSAFDAKATFRDRIGVSKVETEMPFFREGFKLKERDRQELLRVQDSNDPYAIAVINRIYDDAAELLEAAEIVAERQRMQLLFAENGNVGIRIAANGVDYTYNYDPNGDWKASNYFALTGNDLWTAPTTANPFRDIKTAKDAIRNKTGSEAVIAVMNGTTFNLLGQMDAVKNRFISASGRPFAFLSDAEVESVMQQTAGVRCLVYDKVYRDEDKVVHAYVPDNYVALIPAGSLGRTWRGTTPEEADLMGNPNAEVSIVNNGVAITRVVDPHPVNVNIFASEIVLPSYERMDEVALLKVGA